MKVKGVTFVLLMMLAVNEIFAGGFQLNEHSARAMAMGGAFTGLADDPSAVYFNGAGITQLNGFNLMLGSTMISPVFSFRGVSPAITQYDATKQNFFPVHFYATYKYNSDLAFGLGFYSPFGLGSKWGEDWPGRYLAIETSLQVFAISPVVAYKLFDELSVSAGFVYSFANVKITQKTPQTPFAGDAFTSLDGKDNSAFGFNLGALYKPTEDLSVGVSFHSQIKYDLKGNATTTGAPQLASQLPNGTADASLTTPLNLAFGVAYKVLPELLLSADFQYVGWSSYDTLTINFSNPVETVSSPRMYDNTYIIRFGAQYNLFRDLSVLGGIYYDKNPVKPEYINPSLPESNRLGFSLGVDYKMMDNMSLSAAYLFIRNSEITVSDSKEPYMLGSGGFGVPNASGFNGTYNAYANLFSLTLSYSL